MWAEIPAKDFCASVRDGTHDSPKPVENGRYLITSRHIIGGKIDLSNAYLISSDDFEAINKRSKVDRWDVLISMIGTVGEPCLVKEEPEFAIKNIGLFKTKSELDGKWLYYYLTSPQAQALIHQHSRGTTQAYVPLGALRDFPIRVPNDREVMRAITNMLGKLDDKIDLNRRINQTLEAMAQAIFKSWFVDFDPVKAKIAAKQEGRNPLRAAMSAISGKPDAELDALPTEQFEQLAATAALFPDEMEESELGEIPKGWAVGRLDDLLVLQRGFDLPNQDRIPGDFQIVAASGPAGSHSEATVRGPSVVTGRSGVLGRVFLILDDFWPLNTTLWVKEFRAATPCYAYELLRGIDFAAFNAGSAVPTLNRNHIHGLPCLIPHADIMGGFEANALNIHKLLKQNTKEAKSLASLRDTLLPKLLSGELSVTEAMAEAEA